jgi:hypothetical protein
MAHRRHEPLVALAFLLSITVFGVMQVCGSQAKHDQARCDDGGTFKFTLDVPTAQKMKISAEIDAFIWDHWSQHRRAELQIVGQTIEGQTTFQKIFIEPDAHAHWHVRDEEEAAVLKGTQPAKPQMRTDVYDDVQRIDINTGQAIPASQKCTPGTYKLLLINRSKEVQRAF